MKIMNRREALGMLSAGFAGGLMLRKATASESKGNRPPNIIVVFTDDMGYGDPRCYGDPVIDTPNLDRMAREGVRFTDFYCSAAICSPSRAGLLTGRYHVRMGINTVFFPQSKDGLDASEITVAEVLKGAGYATACIGKWHLGHLPQYLPTRHGFDYYFGLPYSNDMSVEKRGDPPLPLMRNEEIIEQPADLNTLTKQYTEEAIRFIGEHRDQPFFLYLPHTMPHIPLHVSETFAGISRRGLYGDVIEEIDWGIGEMLKALQENGIDNNTLMIFTSDNGPWLSQKEAGGSAGLLREGKGTTFEGGMRVPCIMRWPGRIEAGRVEHCMASTLDFMPTFAALAGAAPPEDRALDGEDIRPLLFDGRGRTRETFHYFHQGQHQAFRSGKWKLKRPFKGRIYGKPIEHPTLLFDLGADPGEQYNLAENEPERVAEMEKAMDAFWSSLQPLPPDKS